MLGQQSPKFHPKVSESLFCSHFRNRFFAEVGRRKNRKFQFFCFHNLFTGAWRDSWMRPSVLTSQPPKKATSLQMGPQNTFSGHPKPVVLEYSLWFRGQIGPIVGNALGHLLKAFPWMGPKAKIGPKVLWNTLFYRVWGVSKMPKSVSSKKKKKQRDVAPRACHADMQYCC